MLEVIRVVTGFLKENCYIIHDGINALVIDPGSDQKKILTEINVRNLHVKGILITHYHFDHVGCLEDFKEIYPTARVVDYKDNGDVKIDTFEFKVIQTFGHTMDSASFYFDKNDILFTGDFIFKETIGNFDEDTEEYMINSLKIFKYLSTNVTIYPGHDEETTVSHELKNNPYLRGL
jgi:glyoxylase-like metal-dependent hydrolase (beta-lactamase superfamily II)